MEAEVRTPRLVDDQRHGRLVCDLRQAGDVGRHPVVGRRDDERGARIGSGPQRPRERVRGDAVGDPERRVVLREHEARQATAQDEAVDDRSVRVALHDDPPAEPGQRQAQSVVALRGAVGQEPALAGAECARRHRLGPFVRGRRRTKVDPVDQLRYVGGQGVDADRLDHARIGPAAALVARDVEAGRASERVCHDRVEIRRDGLLELGPRLGLWVDGRHYRVRWELDSCTRHRTQRRVGARKMGRSATAG